MPTRRTLVLVALVLALAGLGSGCEEAPVTRVDRETFVQAYVEIRAAALEMEDTQPTEGMRQEILSRYGVTAQDLVDFVEVHGEDVQYMRDLWDEIEVRLEVDSLPATTS